MMLQCYFSGSPYVHVNPDIYFFSIFFVMYIHPQKSCTSKGATEKKKSRAYIRIKKKNAHGKEFHITGASMFDLASNVS